MKKLLVTFCLFCTLFAEQDLVEIINKYYKQLDQHAKRSARVESLTKAYEKFTHLPALQDFLTYEGIESTTIEIANSRKISNKQMGFFYPAKLYDNHQKLIVAMSPLRRSQIKAKLNNLRADLASEIAAKKVQETALKTLDKTIAKLGEKQRKANLQLQQIEQAINLLEQRIDDGRSEIDSRRSLLRSNAEEELRLIAIIRRLDGQIVREVDEIRRASLVRRRNAFERQRRAIIAEEDRFIRDARKIEAQISIDLRQINSLKRQLPKIEEKASQASPELEDLKNKRAQILSGIEALEEKLLPLDTLNQEKAETLEVINEYQKWWQTAKHRPKYHFLLAMYAIDKLPKQNIDIQVKEWIGLEGIVEVYFR
ncbi:hypothetical protein [Candidatus Uabimicrobium sp. HlEnr_7]|uniref:hypothetical protein n=1 Tax=Candidatus Uabimicrobium helgolandensis TaxID=3095367 RepID=UPI003556A59D